MQRLRESLLVMVGRGSSGVMMCLPETNKLAVLKFDIHSDVSKLLNARRGHKQSEVDNHNPELP